MFVIEKTIKTRGGRRCGKAGKVKERRERGRGRGIEGAIEKKAFSRWGTSGSFSIIRHGTFSVA